LSMVTSHAQAFRWWLTNIQRCWCNQPSIQLQPLDRIPRVRNASSVLCACHKDALWTLVRAVRGKVVRCRFWQIRPDVMVGKTSMDGTRLHVVAVVAACWSTGWKME
jgi:hypothetical protein